MHQPAATLGALTAAALLAGCATSTQTPDARTATVQRTANGVAHVSAPDAETLAYGVAYAHAQDNVCQTANQLVTIRGERARHFGGGTTSGLLGRRVLPNEQIDFFIAAHMNDAALDQQWAGTSAEARALARGYVAGYNRFLADQSGKLPAACNGQAWVQPMTMGEYRRLGELTAVQAATAALADAMLGARPPAPTAALPAPLDLADASQAMRDAGLLDSPLGSNAWAFGKDTTANGSGLLLGNPHFPWAGVNRFWQMHLTIPGQFDVMGAGLGQGAAVQIGFNKDVAWSHTVSTGKRFTLHELALVAGDPTSYLIDGQPVKMSSRAVAIKVRAADGTLQDKTHTVWSTRWGPVVVVPRAGLTWTAKNAYALQDANAGNARFTDTWLAFARATSTADLRQGMTNIGLPWVNTIAADRHGNAMYADVSAVPDVDAAQLQRCAPSPQAAALRNAAGLVVLDGSKSDCGWRRDAASPVAGLTPIERMPIAVRSDWVHNSNDSFFHTNPAQRFGDISPLVGDARVERPRTRAGLTEIPELLARGKVTPAAVQKQLFENRNFMGSVVVPDLLAACTASPPASAESRDGCAALAGWNRTSDLDARGAHLFREFWRSARTIPGVYRVPFDSNRPAATPSGLKMADAAVAEKVWDALAKAVKSVRSAGFALDAPLGSVQRPLITDDPIALHGGDEFEGVLNNLGNQFAPGIGPKGLRIDYGTSYVQTVTFDARGPVAQAILTYGQSTDPASPRATDQLRLFSAKQWTPLPFHAADVAQARVGEVLRLTRP
jgi:acyl-homoserine-lactone acylase